ncbi:hypothetical protein ACMFMG_002775 [Clarireedia jacksonii]
MVNLNINWKGYPHRNFPRIHITSSRPTSVSPASRRGFHNSGKYCGISNCRALEQARRKQKLDNRKSRKSCTSSSLARSRRRATQRAREDIQVFGWKSPRTDIIDVDNQPLFVNGRMLPSTESSLRPVIDSVDGAAHSAVKRARPCKGKELYSLMQVADVPICKPTRVNQRSPMNRGTPPSSGLSKQVGREYAHVGPINQVSNKNAPVRDFNQAGERTYDSRILYRRYSPSTRTFQFSSAASEASGRRTGPRTSKAFLAASTLASLYEQAAKNPNEIQQQTSSAENSAQKENRKQGSIELLESSALASLARRKSFSSSVHSVVNSIASHPSSRSPSQRLALKRFTRDLELYLQAARHIPKQTPITSAPSTSFSTGTVQTVQELKPYRAEFQAAGLAVTSDDQRGKKRTDLKRRQTASKANSVEQRRKTVPEVKPPPLSFQSQKLVGAPNIRQRRSLSNIGEVPQSPATEGDMSAKSPNLLTKKAPTKLNGDSVQRHVQERETSAMSEASDDTIIDWTPKYEMQKPITRLGVLPRSPLSPPISSPTFVSGKNEANISKTTTPRKPPAKKSLPWLRKLQSSQPIPALMTPAKKTDAGSAMPGDANDSPPYSEFTSQPDSQSSSIVLHLDTPSEYRMTNQPRTPETPKTPYLPTTPTTTPYPEPYSGPEDSDHVEVTDFASRRKKSSLGQIVTVATPQDQTQTVHHATQTSAAQSFTTRDRRFSAQIPAQIQSQQRRGLVLKPQAAAGGVVPESTPPHQISCLASSSKVSPLRCTLCNVELGNATSQSQTTTVTSRDSDPGLVQDHGQKSLPSYEGLSVTTTCEKCNLYIAESKKPAPIKDSTSHPPRNMIQEAKVPPNEITSIPSNGKEREPDAVTGAGSYTLQYEIRPSNERGKQDSFHDPDPILDSTKEQSKPQPSTTYEKHTSSSRPKPPAASAPPPPSEQIITYAAVPILLNLQHPPQSLPSSQQSSQQSSQPQPHTQTYSFPLSQSSLTMQLEYLESSAATQEQTRKLFKGLRVATAAACEEGVDKFLEDITGVGVRRLLMDLSRLDGLGINGLAEVARRTGRKRREVLLGLKGRDGSSEKDGRGSGERTGSEDGMDKDERARNVGSAGERAAEWKEKEKVRARQMDRRLGLVASDQGVRLRAEGEDVFMGGGRGYMGNMAREKEKGKEREREM